MLNSLYMNEEYEHPVIDFDMIVKQRSSDLKEESVQ